MKGELSKHELRIVEDAIRLHKRHEDKDLLHDPHEIWLLAGDAVKSIIPRYDYCPFVCEVVQGMIDHYIAQYRAS